MRLLMRLSIGVVTLVSSAVLVAQTSITPPKNDYTPAEDVKLGKEAAAEVEKQMPLVKDGKVSSCNTFSATSL